MRFSDPYSTNRYDNLYCKLRFQYFSMNVQEGFISIIILAIPIVNASI